MCDPQCFTRHTKRGFSKLVMTVKSHPSHTTAKYGFKWASCPKTIIHECHIIWNPNCRERPKSEVYTSSNAQLTPHVSPANLGWTFTVANKICWGSFGWMGGLNLFKVRVHGFKKDTELWSELISDWLQRHYTHWLNITSLSVNNLLQAG